MERLRAKYEDIELYHAGLPHFPRNFTRDSVISGILMEDWAALRNQLLFSGLKQGKGNNPLSGEELGKIFHEYPGFMINGLSTEFSACDTTALFLLGHYYYGMNTGDDSLLKLQRENIVAGAGYIKQHLVNGVFYETPSFSGAEGFALKVTYWKDSAIIRRENGTPSYPVTYFLAHVMNMAAMRSAAKMLGSTELSQIADEMRDAVHTFFDRQSKSFYLAIDAKGPIDCVSSDMLHALFYLEPGDLHDEELSAICSAAKELETPIGYVTLAQAARAETDDSYHADTVWPFEQAIIYAGARKFGLEDILNVSSRVIAGLDTAPEIFIVSPTEIKKGGCDPQLWTIAAKKYFAAIPVKIPAS
jgi:glycogen debranching enzyme